MDRHLVVPYVSRSSFHERAAEFMRAGLAAGQRLEYVGSGTVGDLRDELEAIIDGLGEAARADVRVRTVEDFYAFDERSMSVVDVAATLASHATGAEAAKAAGYTGVCAVVDATTLVAGAEQREAFARYEHQFDSFRQGRSMSAICAYGVSAVIELATMLELDAVLIEELSS